MKKYLNYSQRDSYNFIVAIFLLVLYEGFIRLFHPLGRYQVVNGVDAWFNALICLIPWGTWVVALLVLAVGIVVFIRDIKAGTTVEWKYVIGMLGEAFLYAVILFLILPFLFHMILVNQMDVNPPPGRLQNVVLSLGAGFYEELFFRLILVKVILFFFHLFFDRKVSSFVGILVALLAAILFSLAHYIGPYADSFGIYSFLYRFVFGLIMNILLIWRKFGITAWTHALYDILVVMI